MNEFTENVKQRQGFTQPPLALSEAVQLLGADQQLRPVKRTDYLDDGSEMVTYYLELTKEQYGILTGA